MTTPIQDQWNYSETIAAWFEQHYDLGCVREVARMGDASWNTVWSVATVVDRFILRMSGPWKVAESVAFEHELMRFMRKALPCVPMPIASRSGETVAQWNGRVVSVFEWRPGVCDGNINTSQCFRAGRTLAEIHRRGSTWPRDYQRPRARTVLDFDWTANHTWRWTELLEEMHRSARRSAPAGRGVAVVIGFEHIQLLERDRLLCMAFVERWRRAASVGVVHGDYQPRNVLFTGDDVSAVVDWDDCRLECREFECAQFLWQFGRGSREVLPRAELIAAMAEGYSVVLPGYWPDRDVLAEFLRCHLLRQALFSISASVRGVQLSSAYDDEAAAAISCLNRGVAVP